MSWLIGFESFGTGGSSGAFVREFHNGDVEIVGSLTVTELVSTTVIETGDNIIRLNTDIIGVPSEDAGLEVERGSELDAQLFWDETLNRWTAGIDGSLAVLALYGDNISNFTNDLGYLTETTHDALPADNPHAVTAAQVGAPDLATFNTHAARHQPSGADPLPTAAAVGINANSTNSVGTSESFARADHTHDPATGAVSTQTPDQANAEGSSANLARADHTHSIPTAAPATVGTANAQGSAASFARSDHVHNHGTQTEPTHHAIATPSANGFLSASDKTKLDTVPTAGASKLVSRHYVTGITSNPSITNGAYADLPQMTVTFTPVKATNIIKVQFCGDFYDTNDKDHMMSCKLVLDGVDVPSSTRGGYTRTNRGHCTINLLHTQTMTVAPHTIKVQARTTEAGGIAATTQRVLLVEEWEY